MWLRRIWTRIRDTVVKKFGVWVDKECPLIEDKDDLDGSHTWHLLRLLIIHHGLPPFLLLPLPSVNCW